MCWVEYALCTSGAYIPRYRCVCYKDCGSCKVEGQCFYLSINWAFGLCDTVTVTDRSPFARRLN